MTFTFASFVFWGTESHCVTQGGLEFAVSSAGMMHHKPTDFSYLCVLLNF